jgi:hypothetical protein
MPVLISKYYLHCLPSLRMFFSAQAYDSALLSATRLYPVTPYNVQKSLPDNRSSVLVYQSIHHHQFRSELSSGMYCRVKWLSTDVSELRIASNTRDEHPWWWRQYAPLKRRSTIILHDSITQKTALDLQVLQQWHWFTQHPPTMISGRSGCLVPKKTRQTDRHPGPQNVRRHYSQEHNINEEVVDFNDESFSINKCKVTNYRQIYSCITLRSFTFNVR